MISPRTFLPYTLAFVIAGAICASQLVIPSVAAHQVGDEDMTPDREVLDLNLASSAELKSLETGDNYVRRVVDGRPYTAKNQLVTRGILPATVYEGIKERIVAHRVKPVPLPKP